MSKTNEPAFQRVQYEFTGYMRNPEEEKPFEDIPKARLAVYSRLIYNNVESFLSNGFPILRSVTQDDVWHRLVRRFVRDHQSQTPYFSQLTAEFLDFLANEVTKEDYPHPFFLELAHYEWVEIALLRHEDTIDVDGYDPTGDLLAGVPVVSPLAWPLAYEYPVNRINKNFIPDSPEDTPYYVVVYRSLDDQVHFLELNQVTARLLNLLQQNKHQSGLEVVEQLIAELQHPNPQVVIDGARDTIKTMHQKDILLGTLKNS